MPAAVRFGLKTLEDEGDEGVDVNSIVLGASIGPLVTGIFVFVVLARLRARAPASEGP